MVRRDARGEPTRFERDKRKEREKSSTDRFLTERSFADKWTATINQETRTTHRSKKGKRLRLPKQGKIKEVGRYFTNKRNAINMSNTKTARHAPVQGHKLSYRQLSVD